MKKILVVRALGSCIAGITSILRDVYTRLKLRKGYPNGGIMKILLKANKEAKIIKMFCDIDMILRRELIPKERITVLEFMDEYEVSPELMIRAYKHTVEKRNITNVGYVISVAKKWINKDSSIVRKRELISLDNTHDKDDERKALFHIIAGNEELWNLRNSIYDFTNHSIRTEILGSNICSSSMTLIKLGFNLYNNYDSGSVLDIFSGLYYKNFELAMKAVRERFGKKAIE